MKEQCSKCNSRYCPEGYERASKRELISARDLYLKNRGNVMSAYGDDEVPESVVKQFPEIRGC